MITAIIIDDEKNARESLLINLNNYCPEIKIVAEVGSVSEGLEAIRKNKPDVVFLDIMMPDGTGFDLIEQFIAEKEGAEEVNFKIIFITAHNQFAINAIRFSALDYLLKPVNSDELIAAVNRIPVQKTDSKNFDVLINNIKQIKQSNKKIILNTAKNIFICNVNDTIRCESDQSYTTVFLKNGESVLISKSIKEFEEMLKDFDFIRVHRSHLVNINHINKINKSEGTYYLVSDKINIPIASARKDEILKIIASL
ncbi:MAG: LytTR family DNA-binding domain-containing protein [Bacteroidales bacterium]